MKAVLKKIHAVGVDTGVSLLHVASHKMQQFRFYSDMKLATRYTATSQVFS